MSLRAELFLKKTLGEDALASLEKFELYKPGTRSTIDHEEIRTALQIVPRTILALLIRELAPMEIGENKEVNLFVQGNAILKVTKHERDVFSGQIEQDNKNIVEFKLRSLPGIGLVIMSAFELYDMDNLINSHSSQITEEMSQKVQKLIDERLALHDLVGKVIDKKIMEKDAINNLVLSKLTEVLNFSKNDNPDKEADAELGEQVEHLVEIHEEENKEAELKEKGPEKLKKFLEHRKNKSKPKEFHIQMNKGEKVNCPDCKKNIFDGNSLNTCICYGDAGKILIKKSENGIKVRFSKNWDIDNIEMLLDILRRKRG